MTTFAKTMAATAIVRVFLHLVIQINAPGN
jgi:hypothetical protein